MGKIVAVVALSVLMVFACGQEAQEKSLPLLANLKEGEHVEVWLGSRHCYGSSRYFFLFVPDKVVVSEVHEDGEGNLSKEEIGALPMLGDDLKKLDALFQEYRNGNGRSNCLTVESVSYEHWRGERRLLKVVMVDPDPSRLDWKERGTLWTLVERLRKR